MPAIAAANLMAKTDLFTNPMGLDRFEFVELASPEQGILEPIFEMLSFSKVAHHRSKMLLYFAKVLLILSLITNQQAMRPSLLKSIAQPLAAWPFGSGVHSMHITGLWM